LRRSSTIEEEEIAMNTSTLEEARAAKRQALTVFSSLVEVVGVGITRIDEGYGLKINLLENPRPDVRLPEAVDNVPVRTAIVGKVAKR